MLVMGLFAAGSAQAYMPDLEVAASDKGQMALDNCRPWFENVEPLSCSYGDSTSRIKIALVGDSHAMQWGPPLIRLARKRGWHLVTFLRANCPIADVSYDPDCDKWRRNAFDAIDAARPKHIIVSTSIGARYRLKSGGEEISRRASEPRLRAGMTRTLKRLLKTPGLVRNRTAVRVIRDQAMAPFVPALCLARRPDNPFSCRFESRRTFGPGFDWIAAKRAGILPAIDPLKVLCGPRWCYSTRGQMLIYRDTDHLTATFARTLARWLGKRLGIR